MILKTIFTPEHAEQLASFKKIQPEQPLIISINSALEEIRDKLEAIGIKSINFQSTSAVQVKQIIKHIAGAKILPAGAQTHAEAFLAGRNRS